MSTQCCVAGREPDVRAPVLAYGRCQDAVAVVALLCRRGACCVCSGGTQWALRHGPPSAGRLRISPALCRSSVGHALCAWRRTPVML